MPEQKREKPAPANVMAELLASLDGVDDYGIPPLTVYQRFNTAGSETHGSYAVAQGARGWGLDIGAGFNFADLFAPKSGIKVTANLDAGGARLPSSAVFLYRMPKQLTKVNNKTYALSLAQIDGVSWTGKLKLTGTIGFDFDVLAVIAKAGIAARVSAQVMVTTTKLQSRKTSYFAASEKKALADEVDRMLVIELRKACKSILTAQAGWISKNLPAIGLDTAGSALAMAKAAYGEDIKKLAEAQIKQRATPLLVRLQREDGWKIALAGSEVALVGAAATGVLGVTLYAAGKKAVDLFAKTDKGLFEGLALLQNRLTQRRDQLLANKPKPLPQNEQKELNELNAALPRLNGFVQAIQRKNYPRDQIFAGLAPGHPGPQPRPIDTTSRDDGTTLRLTSYDWELRGDFDANLSAVTIGAVTEHADVSVKGRNTTFHLRMRAANNLTYAQHTKTSFVQTTLAAAQTLQLIHTGVDEADKRILKKLRTEDTVNRQTPGAPWKRRFGALVYRSANVYCTVNAGGFRQGTKYPVTSRLSGITIGASVRVAPLCDYADQVSANGPLTKETAALEAWLGEQIACPAIYLKEFIKSAPLGSGYKPRLDKEHGHTIGYPDALLIEASYCSPGAPDVIKAPLDDADLFELFDYKSPKQFASQIGKQRVLVALRLRYRVQSPLSKISKKSPRLGVSKYLINCQLDRQTEIGHESVVDLYTQYPLQPNSENPVLDADRTIPPVVLFNRG